MAGETAAGEDAATLAEARVAAKTCRRCPLWHDATQTVFGEGPQDAEVVFVGEQPGDQEDIAGKPFVGPAGKVFDAVLAEAGIERGKAYVTNAVKHFKFERRGKRRLHARPNAGEVRACRWWLDKELGFIRPRLAVALGATAALALTVPASLSADRKSRSKETVELLVTTTVTLTTGVPRVDIHTRVDNRAKDHRLRVCFPAPFHTDAASHDGHFEIVKRPIGVPEFDDSWAEQPRPETHQRSFTSVSDGRDALTLANRGLPEVEVLERKSGDGVEIALTLLRCVGRLSRDDFSTRKNHAGPFLETPNAQMLGEWEFDYSIIVGESGNWSYQQAWNFDSPLRAVSTGLHAGTLPASGSFVRVDNAAFLLSAVKEAEDGSGWIVRGCNLGGEEIQVTLAPWRKFAKAERVNMAEETVARLKVGRGGEVAVHARGHEAVTVKFVG